MSLTCSSVSIYRALTTTRPPRSNHNGALRHQFGTTHATETLNARSTGLSVKLPSPSLQVWAKRSQKKKQARKLERREETRDFEERMRMVKEKAEQEAKKKPPAIPPPTTVEEAQERVETAMARAAAAVARVKQLKLAARESEEFEQNIGYKAFPEVIDAVEDLDACRVSYHEEVLERALLKMSEITGKPRSLDSFNWRFGDGTKKNASCCGYMLQACQKGGMVEVAAEIVAVLEDAGALGQLDEKIIQWLDSAPAAA